MSGTSGNDTILGADFAETIFAGAGDDSVEAAGGDDWIYAEDGNDTVGGGNGDDVIWASGGNDSVKGNAGHDFIFGGTGDDTLSGGGGNDTVRGEAGNDLLQGGVGDDTIEALSANGANGDGDDTLDGGAGADLFVISRRQTSLDPFPGDNVQEVLILDFEAGVDRIQIGSPNWSSATVAGGVVITWGNQLNTIFLADETAFSSADLIISDQVL